MYDQFHSAQVVTALEAQQLAEAAERRRRIREHADQIVPGRVGIVRRLIRRIAGARRDAGARSASRGIESC